MNWGQSITVSVPGTSANLGPGFDCLGMALGIRDELTITLEPQPGVRLKVSGCGSGQVPATEEHLVVRAVRFGLAHYGIDQPPGLELSGHNRIPHGRGLGSSAAAVVAGLAAGIALAKVIDGHPPAAALAVEQRELLTLATYFEGHPDNAAAAIYGGLTIAWCEGDQPRAAVISPHRELAGLLLVPSAQLATAAARQALPDQVPHADAALTAGRAALLMIAITQEPTLLYAATEERLHQEQRAGAMPQSLALLRAIRKRGLAAVVSGAGPSLLVLTTEDQISAVSRQVRELLADEATASGLALTDWQLITPAIGGPGVALSA